jgi:hypothetical protein
LTFGECQRVETDDTDYRALWQSSGWAIWCSLAFHSHRGFSPVISLAFNSESRFNGFRGSEQRKPLKTVHGQKGRTLTTGLKPRCE